MKSCLYTKWSKFISSIILYYLIITATNAFKSILTCTGSSYKFLANVCFIQSPRGPHHAVRHMRTLGPEAGIYVIAPTVFCAMQLLIPVWDTSFQTATNLRLVSAFKPHMRIWGFEAFVLHTTKTRRGRGLIKLAWRGNSQPYELPGCLLIGLQIVGLLS